MKLPPMNALRAFEAVSRLGSVSKAAEELCVSQGAVSQQLRNLEDHLGREMFIRSPHSFALSEDGEEFAEVVQHSLKQIAMAAGKVKREQDQLSLTVSLPPGLAERWLMGRLGEFFELNPDITIALDKRIAMVTFRNDGIDAAIRYGDGNFEDLDSAFLFTPKKFAVASPSYLSEFGKLDDLKNPERHRLIDCRYGSKELDALCGVWEDMVASDYPDLESQLIIFPDDRQALNAAIHGRGIALTPNHLLAEPIEAGTIALANPRPIVFQGSYYFVSPSEARPNDALDAFRDWVVEISGEFRSGENFS